MFDHFNRIFHEINHPTIGVPPFMETPIYICIYIYVYINMYPNIWGFSSPPFDGSPFFVTQRPGVGHSRGDAVFALLRSHHVHPCSVTENHCISVYICRYMRIQHIYIYVYIYIYI